MADVRVASTVSRRRQSQLTLPTRENDSTAIVLVNTATVANLDVSMRQPLGMHVLDGGEQLEQQ